VLDLIVAENDSILEVIIVMPFMQKSDIPALPTHDWSDSSLERVGNSNAIWVFGAQETSTLLILSVETRYLLLEIRTIPPLNIYKQITQSP
jgi:hypothetical protein